MRARRGDPAREPRFGSRSYCHGFDETSGTLRYCRQVLAEFNPNMKVFAPTLGGEVQQFELAELLPLPGQGVLEGMRRV